MTTYKAQVLNTMHLSTTLREKMFESGTTTCYICLRVAITDDLLINTDMGVPTIPNSTSTPNVPY